MAGTDAVQVVTATAAHVEALAPRMRAEDAAEVLASGGYSPREALEASLRLSQRAWALCLRGELAALFGVAIPAGEPYAVPWALTGGAVARHPRLFWRASVGILDVLSERHPVLVQRVDARYTAALRWLRRLGFEVHPAEPWGAAGLPFHPVVYRRPHV